ncbi:unnamed protein product [Caenorhabditis bovis]|uniref:Regulatory protein zeste n=1 Tax=Caenorhabditis bovis TaxID=2654633 RepID=A0A8S1F139_9PELO|nr:unnamed protein product [Caenorhabditis bovis]
MDRILEMVKSAGAETVVPQNTVRPEPLREAPTLQNINASTSHSDDSANFVEWAETENGETRNNNRPVYDSREKKLQDKIDFVKIVYRHKSQLFGDCDGHEVTAKSKEEAWKKVATEIEEYGLESFKGKHWARLRDHDWQYVRRHAISRSNENVTKATGKLGELDSIVLDIITTTALVNSISSNNSSLSQSQGSGSSTQQSTESVEHVLRILGNSNQHDSTDISEAGDDAERTARVKSEDTACLLDILSRVSQTVTLPTPPQSLSVDSGNQKLRTEAKSPTLNRKMTIRSATAPSVYAITSSTSPQQPVSSSQAPPIKKARVDSEKSPVLHTPSYEQQREKLLIKKLEAEVRHIELLNEKLEAEIRANEAQERRTNERHALEMRAAKNRLLRGSAIDEPSMDMTEGGRHPHFV